MSEDFASVVASTEGPQPMRRLFHAGTGVGVATLLWALGPPKTVSVGSAGVVVLGLLALDLARLAAPTLNLRYFRLFRMILSPREAGGIASSTWYMAGILGTLILFPLEAVVPAIWVLALADPAANYIGRRWGRRQLGTGTWEGLGAFVVVAGAVLLLAAEPPAALLAALLAGLAEIVPWRVDDNVTIPLVVSGVLWLGG